MEKDDGGSAFPVYPRMVDGNLAFPKGCFGMSLRDYFAAAAIPAIIANSSPKSGVILSDMVDATATLSYLIADAMLEARDK